jgi:hypothetical protein
MPAPVLTLTDDNNNPLSVINFGVVDAGNQTGGTIIRIWNNQANVSNISDAINPQLTTKTYNGLDSGDSIQNGQEVVTNQMIGAQCLSSGQTSYLSIGGQNSLAISNLPSTGNGSLVIPATSTAGSPQYSRVQLRAVVPPSATPGNINFLLRVTYQYS